MRLKIVLDDVSNVTALDCVRHSLGEDELLLPFRQIREAQIGDEGDKAILKLLVPMTLQNAVNLLLKVLELLLCSLSHVLHILLLVQGDFQRTAVCVHALQDLPVLHASLEKGGV